MTIKALQLPRNRIPKFFFLKIDITGVIYSTERENLCVINRDILVYQS